jgi:hypothetical protein
VTVGAGADGGSGGWDCANAEDPRNPLSNGTSDKRLAGLFIWFF